VGGFFGFGYESAKMRLSAVAQVILFDGAVPEVEQSEAEAKLSGRGSLHHAVPLKDHQEAVGSAFVQLQ
jgi:hypothetical protein